MHVNANTIRIPRQTRYAFADGELHNDPMAVSNFYAQAAKNRNSPMARLFEKNKRTQRLAARAAKANRRHQA